MNKPLLLIITGSAASGKTTLAHLLSGRINCPLISRDELKEGLLNTLHLTHSQSDKDIDWQVYEVFFEAIQLLLSKKISLIAEAAFQDHLWRQKLTGLSSWADIKIIICRASHDLIKTRFADRLLHNPGREKYHGDQSVNLSGERFASLVENYKPVSIDAPVLEVDTTDSYNPDIDAIVDFILNEREVK